MRTLFTWKFKIARTFFARFFLRENQSSLKKRFEKDHNFDYFWLMHCRKAVRLVFFVLFYLGSYLLQTNFDFQLRRERPLLRGKLPHQQNYLLLLHTTPNSSRRWKGLASLQLCNTLFATPLENVHFSLHCFFFPPLCTFTKKEERSLVSPGFLSVSYYLSLSKQERNKNLLFREFHGQVLNHAQPDLARGAHAFNG